jgi:hypothetical protein
MEGISMSQLSYPHHVIDEALCGVRGEDQQRIAEEGMRWLDVILKKNLAYGSSVWHHPILDPELPVCAAILTRMSDKVSRIAQLRSGVKDEVDEALEDTIQDLGAYCLLYLARPKEKAPAEVAEAVCQWEVKWEGLFAPPTQDSQ